MTLLRTGHSLAGVITLVLLLCAFRGELRVALNGVDSPSLALAIPVLALAALVTGITSAATALTLEIAALILLGLAMMEDGGGVLRLASAIGLAGLAGMSSALIRFGPGPDD